jgi:hypothetical protein
MRYVKACSALALFAGVLAMLAGCDGVRRRAVPAPTLVSTPARITPDDPMRTTPDDLEPTVPVKPKPTVPKTERPLVVDARTFAQELYDDTSGNAFGRYVPKTLEIEGVVAGSVKWDGFPIKDARDPIGIIDFVVPVTDSRKGGTREYKIHCRFKQPVAPEDAKFPGLAKGKVVTIHGRLTGATPGQPDAILNDCVIFRD